MTGVIVHRAASIACLPAGQWRGDATAGSAHGGGGGVAAEDHHPLAPLLERRDRAADAKILAVEDSPVNGTSSTVFRPMSDS
jgi:hypothetical protein